MKLNKVKSLEKSASFSLGELAEHVGGQVEPRYSSILIERVATIEKAGAGNICFLENEKYKKFLEHAQGCAVLVSQSMAQHCCGPVVIVENPKFAFSKIIRLFHPEKVQKPGIHPSVILGNNTFVDPSAYIGPYCVLGDDIIIQANVILNAQVTLGDNCHIGKNSYIHANVHLYSNVVLGQHNIIHSGVVLGSDGFGFVQDKQQWIKIPHIGGVLVGNNVEIGANTTVDRGVIENTVIEDNVIIDNLVQIAHNVHIGTGTAIAGCVGIAGSAKIGAYCQIGGGSIINGHLTIADYTYFIGGSQVGNSIKKSGVYSSGIPAKEYTSWIKNVARFHQLDAIADRLKVVENKLKTQD